jgi:hypothetical protein
MSRSFLSALAASVSLAIASGADAATVRPVEGSVILSKSGVTAEYLWDATTYVSDLVTDRLLGDDGLRATEATAIAALAQRSSSSTSKDMNISVVYKKPSSSAIYGTATFADQQRLVEISVPRALAAKNGLGLAQDVADGKTPPQVKITVIGELPPAQ